MKSIGIWSSNGLQWLLSAVKLESLMLKFQSEMQILPVFFRQHFGDKATGSSQCMIFYILSFSVLSVPCDRPWWLMKMRTCHDRCHVCLIPSTLCLPLDHWMHPLRRRSRVLQRPSLGNHGHFIVAWWDTVYSHWYRYISGLVQDFNIFSV